MGRKRKESVAEAPPAGIQTCRVCGCTDDNCQQCIDKTGEPCHWVEPDLCSACENDIEMRGRPREEFAGLKKTVHRISQEMAEKVNVATLAAMEPPATGKLMELWPADIVANPKNPRHFQADGAYRELVASVRAVGVLQPILVRPDATRDCYELVFGERRWRAASEVELKSIPAIVRDLSDKDAAEIMVRENMDRADLSPIEEADAVQLLLDTGWTREEIADRRGKSPGWVARRAALKNLSPAWRKALEKQESPVYGWSGAALERVARLPEAAQAKLLGLGWGMEDCGGRPAKLDRLIAQEILGTLNGAPWSLDDETLLPKAGACSSCPKRSQADPQLFDDLDVGGKKSPKHLDRCLDPQCYRAKGLELVKRKRAELAAEHGNVMLVMDGGYSHHDQQEIAKSLKVKQDDLTRGYQYTAAKAGEKGAKPALVVNGKGAGSVRWLKKGHEYQSGPSGNGAGKPKPAKPAKEVRELRRKAWIVKNLHERLFDLSDGDADALRRNGGTLALAALFGGYPEKRPVSAESSAAWKKQLIQLRDQPAELTEREVCRMAAQEIAHHVLRANDHAAAECSYPHVKNVCELLDLKLQDLEEDALAEIPEPAGAAAAGKGKGKGKRRVRETAAKAESRTPAPKPAGKKGKKGGRKAAEIGCDMQCATCSAQNCNARQE